MGVLGLWQLLAPVGQPVTLESLENKIFAVDISIWLNQAVKGYRDSQGGSVPNAHLLSLFSRICKLLFYKIRPIIVFDGGFPELKKQTIINRQQRRAAVKQSSREVGLKILTNYLASQQLVQTNDVPSNSKTTFRGKEKPQDEIFKLPSLPESSQSILSDSCESSEDNERKFTNFSKEDIKYLNKIDLDSEDFLALPPDVKLEILSTLKESRRHRTWEQFEELPKEYNDFSNYQMQCLLKRRKLQGKLEQVQKDIRAINSSAYVSQYTNDHVIGETNKIMSDDTSYYVLLKKIVDTKGSSPNKKYLDGKPSISVMSDTKTAFIRDIENIDVDDEFSETFSNEVENESKNIILNEISKIEKHSLNLADDEYDVDNPPVGDVTIYVSPVKISTKHESGFIESSALDEESIAECYAEQSSSKTVRILNEKCDTSVKKVSNDSKTETEILTLEQNIKSKNVLEETVIVFSSDDDEMISCDEVDTNYLYESFSKKCEDNLENNCLVSLTTESAVSESDFFKKNENTSINKSVAGKSPVSEKQVKNASGISHLDSLSTVSSKQLDSDYSRNVDENVLEAPVAEKQIEGAASDGNLVSLPTASSSKQVPSHSSRIVDENLLEANTELQRNLETAAAILEAERAKQDRQANTVQDHMIQECKELLRLFGIPYIVSPLEAEAQCAFYDKADLTHGTITDDSDVWLFGGKRVYKNFFTQQKFVESYKDKEIFMHFGLSRNKLINFALLTGSDYTEGIEGVGPVTATEIISEFPGEGMDALQKFKDWWHDSNKHARPPENKVRAKFKKLVLAHNFPNEKVFDAYLNPEVDDSTEKFTWGRPDLDAIREYAKERFGWNQSKVDDALLPVLKKLNERDRQTHIDSFFTVTLKKEKNLFPSKRIMSALKKITSPHKGETCHEVATKAVKRKARTSAKKAVPSKINKKVSSARERKRNTKSQGPVLSEESSSDSNS